MSARLKRSLVMMNNQDKIFVRTKELTWMCTTIMGTDIARKFKREIKKEYPNTRVYIRYFYASSSGDNNTVDIKFDSEEDEAEFILKESL